MNRVILATSFAMLALSGSAMAADIAAPAPAFDWTGFYAGLNGGYGFSGSDKVGVTGVGKVGDLNVNGWFGGAQAGYNYQVNAVVLGLEGDIQLSDIGDSDSNVVGTTWDSSDDINYWGTLRGRLGFAFDQALIYGTGGFAFGGMDYQVQTPGVNISDNYADWGWTAGGGLEYAFDEAWSMKAEYLYVNLASKRISDGPVSTKATPDFQSVRLGVNFRF